MTLVASKDTRIIAKADGMTRKAPLMYIEPSVKPDPKSQPKPIAEDATKADDPTAEPKDDPTSEPQEDPTAEPKDEITEEPTEEPAAESTDEITEDPTAEPKEDPTAEPKEEPTAEPTDEITEEPTAEPSAEPTDEITEEPTAEPSAEPCDVGLETGECVATECDVDPVTGECLDEEALGVIEVEASPEAAPKTARFSVAATATLQLRKAGFRAGSGTSPGLSPLAGAYFKVYKADSDDNFEPGGDDVLGGTFGPTNGNGTFNVNLNIDQGDDFWVQEASISNSGWNVITEYALGGYNAAGTTTQYAFKYDLNNGQTTNTRWFVNRRDNNPYPTACGLRVALIFDRSGSIDDGTEYVQMKNAGKSFVDALTGTPSEIAVYSFSISADQNLGWTSVASSGNTVKTAIDDLPAI